MGINDVTTAVAELVRDIDKQKSVLGYIAVTQFVIQWFFQWRTKVWSEKQKFQFEKLHEKKLEALESVMKLVNEIYDLRLQAVGAENFHNEAFQKSTDPHTHVHIDPGFADFYEGSLDEACSEISAKLRELEAIILEKQFMFPYDFLKALEKSKLILGTHQYRLRRNGQVIEKNFSLTTINQQELHAFRPDEFLEVFAIIGKVIRKEYGTEPGFTERAKIWFEKKKQFVWSKLKRT